MDTTTIPHITNNTDNDTNDNADIIINRKPNSHNFRFHGFICYVNEKTNRITITDGQKMIEVKYTKKYNSRDLKKWINLWQNYNIKF